MNILSRLRLFGVLVSIALMGIEPLLAVNVQLFRPQIDHEAGLTVRSSRTLEAGKIEAGVMFNYARHPLEFGRTDTRGRIDDVMKFVLSNNVMFSLGITDFWTFEIDSPFHLADNTELVASETLNKNRDWQLGDLMLRNTFRLRDLFGDGGQKSQMGIALVPYVVLPTGNAERYLGEEKITAGIDWINDAWVSPRSYVAMNLGYEYRQEDQLANLNVGQQIHTRFAYVYKLSTEKTWDLIADVAGRFAVDTFDETHIPFEWTGAVRKKWDNSKWAWTMGLGRGLTQGYGTPDFRVIMGLTYTNHRDQPEPQPTPTPVATPVPTPKPIVKSELKVMVVNNQNEKVDALMQVEHAVKKEDGKAKVDTIYAPQALSEYRFNLSEGKYRVTVSALGHFDGQITGTLDAGETKTEVVRLKKEIKQIELMGKVLFDTNKSSIRAESEAVLSHVVKVLGENPEIKKLQIEAHTDSMGDELYNLELSKDRAERVRLYLIEAGVDASRLTAIGFGESSPIDSNETREGRANNRRVVFTVVESSGGVKIKTSY